MIKETIVKTDKAGEVLWSGDFDMPESVDEFVSTYGEEQCYNMLKNQWKIRLRQANDPRKAESLLPRATQQEIRGAIESGDVTLEELQEFVREKRGKAKK